MHATITPITKWPTFLWGKRQAGQFCDLLELRANGTGRNRLPIAPILTFFVCVSSSFAATLTGTVVDDSTNDPIAARIYIHNSAGDYFHVQCTDGSAIPYDKRRTDESFEVHTTVSAHPFNVDLPAGDYTVTVEKGKEYFTASLGITVTDGAENSIRIPVKRWTNMAAQGWYSGETHVHREVSELPTLQLAEDINVAFPLTAWVTDSEETPVSHNKNKSHVPPAKLIRIDKTHVFWPVNTEYEIFTVRGRQHTLGAVFILNHKEQFSLPAPPVRPIVDEARKQDAFLELDKHNWPWSMMLVPRMNVELYELANNHMWKTGFLYSDWYPEYAGKYMDIEMVDGKFTERGWIDFGFENYYALLNCGFRMRPTAGSASGVHPVPFGFGRVYVQIDGDFTYDNWVQGLLSGRSFVTTGPMLTATVKRAGDHEIHVTGLLESPTEPISVEVLVNGKVAQRIKAEPHRAESGAFQIPLDTHLPITGSSWVVVRAFTKRQGDRISFAHTAPVYVDIVGQPLRPMRNQRDYLVKRVRDELTRSRAVISTEALADFEDALQKFSSIEVAD